MLNGINASSGYAIGNVFIVKEPSLEYIKKSNCDPVSELKRLNDAIEKFCEKTELAAKNIKSAVGEKESEILMGHILMVKDPYMISEIEKNINNGNCSECAVEAVCDMFIEMFSSTDDELTQQRASDVSDIKKGILQILLNADDVDISSAPKGSILVASDLTPSKTAGINLENVVGIVTEIGAKTSHSAILARALELPAVLSVTNAVSTLSNSQTIIIDGNEGIIIDSPTKQQIEEYKNKQKSFFEQKELLKQYIGKKTITADGDRVELLCNIGSIAEVDKILECDGEGVGLFRTEFLFMDKSTLPSEEEQFDVYKKLALKMKNKPVIIRTLDIGGDKDIAYLGLKREENPFLGFRAVRFCLKKEDIFIPQLRALLRASAFGDIRIMIPLVTCVEEFTAVKKLIKKITEELISKQINYNKDIKIGVMIETPAASLIADFLAKEADFFSIGTNDLTQYIMAVDRGNSKVSYLYSVFHPAVLRSIKHIIECAKKENIPVGMCGEAASDKRMIPLLIAFGLDEFSVSPTSVLETRKEISKWNKQKIDSIVQNVMFLQTENEIVELLKSNIDI